MQPLHLESLVSSWHCFLLNFINPKAINEQQTRNCYLTKKNGEKKVFGHFNFVIMFKSIAYCVKKVFRSTKSFKKGSRKLLKPEKADLY
jgi:hypothetical protein